MANSEYHTAALLAPTIDGVLTRRDGIYVDATFGGGGHSRALLSNLSDSAQLFSFDQDKDAFANRIDDRRFCFVLGNFRYLKNFMHFYGVSEIDGLIADLGVSFHHFDDADRGFSFRFSGPLDMRMNRSAQLTARDIVNTYDADRLARIFRLWGEVQDSRRMATAIVTARKTQPLDTTEQLAAIVSPLCGRDKEKKDLARVFQALRIEVNDELGALSDLLEAALALLRVGGRMAILTYHSLEDRLVKNFIRSGNLEGEIKQDFYGRKICPLEPVNKKVIVADDEEVQRNSRARSAKLRIAQKTDTNIN